MISILLIKLTKPCHVALLLNGSMAELILITFPEDMLSKEEGEEKNTRSSQMTDILFDDGVGHQER